jgi:glutathione S-transferase/RNA polymerase-associated protein
MNGERFGRGDAAAYPHVSASAGWGFPLPERFPRLRDWAARCAARESVARDARELAAWMRANLGPSAAASPMPVVRQYRDHRLEWMMKSGGVQIVLDGLARGTVKFAKEVE